MLLHLVERAVGEQVVEPLEQRQRAAPTTSTGRPVQADPLVQLRSTDWLPNVRSAEDTELEELGVVDCPNVPEGWPPPRQARTEEVAGQEMPCSQPP